MYPGANASVAAIRPMLSTRHARDRPSESAPTVSGQSGADRHRGIFPAAGKNQRRAAL
jgi:hypothetical protein